MSCIVYLYYLYRTYILYYYNYIKHKIYDHYKSYQIVVITQDNQRCEVLDLNQHSYTFLNSKIFKSFIVVTHYLYIDQQYSIYYEIITQKINSYDEFMDMEHYKQIEISKCKFMGAEIKNNETTYSIPIEQFLIVSNTLFFKEFNIWLLHHFFKTKYDKPTIQIIDQHVNIIQLEKESLTILENDYVKTI
jgi:hypothetical protein